MGPTDAEKIDNAAKMYGTGSKQHEAAKKKFAPKADKKKSGVSEGWFGDQSRDSVGKWD